MYTDLQLDNIALKAKIYISSLFLCLNPFPCTLKILFTRVSFKCFYKIKTKVYREDILSPKICYNFSTRKTGIFLEKTGYLL